MSCAEELRHFVSEVPAPERANVSNDAPAVQLKLLTNCVPRVGAGGFEPCEVNTARYQFNRSAAFIRVRPARKQNFSRFAGQHDESVRSLEQMAFDPFQASIQVPIGRPDTCIRILFGHEPANVKNQSPA